MSGSGNSNDQNSKPHLSEYEFAQMLQKLEEVLQETDDNYEDFFVEKGFDDFVYRDLGICGGAYVFADAAKNQLVYLHNKAIQSELAKEYKGIPFIEIPYKYYEYEKGYYGTDQQRLKIARDYQEILDIMYISTRDRQPLRGINNQSSPEFYLNLPHLSDPEKLDKLLPFEKYLSQDKFEVIYCTVGEVLFFLSTWRMLVRSAQLRGLDKEESVIRFDEEYVSYGSKEDFWKDVKEFPKLPESSWLSDIKVKKFSQFKLIPRWNDVKKEIDEDPIKSPDGYSSYDEYFRMGMVDEDGILTREFLSLIRYTIHIAEVHLGWEAYYIDRYHLPKANISEEDNRKITSNEHVLSNLYILERRLDIYFQTGTAPHQNYVPKLDLVRSEYSIAECLNRVIRGYLAKSFDKESKGEQKIVDLLTGLHQQCRFPILPYFYELAIGTHHRPKEHLVFCIWHSKQNPIPLRLANGEERKDPAVGFVLLTLSPIWHINKKSHFIKDGRSIHCYKELSEIAYCRLFRIYDFFRFLARPIIDNLFYSRLIKKSIERDYFQDYINSFSHEMSKVTDNIFELSNISVQELFRDNTDRFLEFAKKLIPQGLKVPNEVLKTWRIIPFVDRFQTWSYTLRVWSGRKEKQVFDIEEDANLQEILEKCFELSCQMRVGEFFLRAERVTSLESILEYDKIFKQHYRREKKEKRMLFDFSEKYGNLKFLNCEVDSIIFAQNAILRLLLAAITNILEHTKGDFYIRIEQTSKMVEGNPCIRFVLVNPCKLEFEERRKSLGTKPVITTCLNLIKGTLENFGPFEDTPDARDRKKEWEKKLNITKNKYDLWETSFRFPIKNIFDDIT